MKAILFFSNDVSTQIACLPSGPIDHGEACWVAGWGDTDYDSGKYSNVILSAGVNILGADYCQKYSNIAKLNIDDICAGLPDFDGDGDGLSRRPRIFLIDMTG